MRPGGRLLKGQLVRVIRSRFRGVPGRAIVRINGMEESFQVIDVLEEIRSMKQGVDPQRVIRDRGVSKINRSRGNLRIIRSNLNEIRGEIPRARGIDDALSLISRLERALSNVARSIR
jgi:hypothetical protein